MALTQHPEIGRPFVAGRTGWPAGLRIGLTHEDVQIGLFIVPESPDQLTRLTAVVDTGRLHYTWTHTDGVAILTARLTDPDGTQHLPWHTTPYKARDNAHDGLSPLGAAPGAGKPILATVVLVDATTGLLLAVRSETWPAPVADELAATVNAYRLRPDNPASEDATLTALLAEYGTPPAGPTADRHDDAPRAIPVAGATQITWNTDPGTN